MKQISRHNLDVHVINLDSRTDKLQIFDQQMKRIGWSYQRFSAKTDKHKLPIHLSSRGEEGCFASHFTLIKQALSANTGQMLCIFEDDAQLCEDFVHRFQYLEDHMCLTDWDIFYLSGYYHLPDNVPADWYNYPIQSPFFHDKTMQTYHLTSIPYVHLSHASFTTVAYLVNPKSLKKLYQLILTHMNHPDPRNPQKTTTRAIDHLYMNLQEDNQLLALTSTPGMVTQRPDISDIKGTYFDQNAYFSRVCGPHIYATRLSDFAYQQYFHLPQLDRWHIEYNYYDNEKWNLYGDQGVTHRRYHPFKSKIGHLSPTQSLTSHECLLQYTLYFTPYFREYFPHALQIADHEFQLESHKICESNQVLEYMKGFAKDSICIDVGGNCGLMCIPIGLSGYKTFTFEPVLENLMCLHRSVEENHLQNMVFVQPYALSHQTQSQMIYVPEFRDNASLAKDAAVANLKDKNSREQWCQCITFDQWLAEHQQTCRASDIRFIKIDVQGFELSVLKGMQHFLSQAEDLHILYEIDDNMAQLAKQNSHEIETLLTSLGFVRLQAQDLPPYDQYVSKIEYLFGGNALFVKTPKPRRMDLMDTTFIIPLRIDSPDRENNATIVFNYLTQYFETNIIVLESDVTSHFDQIKLKHPQQITHVFEQTNQPIFHRTRLLNQMLSMVKTPVTVNYDIDVLLPPESYVIARNMIIDESYDVVYPFSNPSVDAFKKHKNTTNQIFRHTYQQWFKTCLVKKPCPCHKKTDPVYYQQDNYAAKVNQVAVDNGLEPNLLWAMCLKLEKKFVIPNKYNEFHVCIDQPPESLLQYKLTQHGMRIPNSIQNRYYAKGVTYIPHDQKTRLKDTLMLDSLDNLSLSMSSAGSGFAIFIKTQSYIQAGGENENFVSWGPEDQERLYKFITLGYKVSSIYDRNLLKLIDGHDALSAEEFQMMPGYDPCFKAVYHLEHARNVNSNSSNPAFQANNQLYQTIKALDLIQLKEYYLNQFKQLQIKYPHLTTQQLPAMVTMLDLGLNGRLGNQMFQYATLYAYSLKMNVPLYWPRIKSSNDLECFKLDDYFDLKGHVLLSITTNQPKVIQQYRHQAIPHIKSVIDQTYTEPCFKYNRHLWTRKPHHGKVNLEGFFQSWKYFEHCVTHIQELFTPKQGIRQQAQMLISQYKSESDKGCLVALHVRRGDNLPLGRQDLPHYVFNQSYINKCLNLMSEKIKKPYVCVVFSDGLEWCQTHLQSQSDSHHSFVFHPSSNDGLDLYIMSLCDHQIISPSSFSWWAAYLNRNQHKVIIYPQPWFRRDHPVLSQYDTSDLLPSEWIGMNITNDDHL